MGNYRLITLLFMAMLCPPVANAVEQKSYFLLFTESRDSDPTLDVGTTEVSGFGMEWRGEREASFVYAGLSAGKMTSDQIISAFGDRNIGYPVFLHVGANMPMGISPYIEYGVELGAVIFNETIENEEANTDTYLAGGVVIQTKAVLLKIYAKEYRIKPYLYPPVDIYLTGVSVGLEF